MFVDSHCHLSFPELHSQRATIFKHMLDMRVTEALCVCTTLEEFPAVHQLALENDGFWASVGVHPDNEGVQEPNVDDLTSRAKLAKVIAVGETGLDYYDMEGRKGGRTVEEMEWQRSRFRTHIRAARTVCKPLIIHTRQASEDTLDILRQEGEGLGGGAGGVFHCFTETVEVARSALNMGYYISFSGIITFKSASELRDVVGMVPLDRMLIETDSPYLAPVPHRGKVNSPAYVPHVAAEVARIKGVSVDTVAQLTAENFHTLFPGARG